MLGVLCLSLLVISPDNTILNVALPTLERDLGASSSQPQWIVDSCMLIFAGLLLTAGAHGDRFGRKRALTFGLAVFGLGSALSAVASSAEPLILTRALMGVGGALIMASTLSILRQAGVGKATLYRRSGSEQELVTAAVRHLNQEIPLPDTGKCAMTSSRWRALCSPPRRAGGDLHAADARRVGRRPGDARDLLREPRRRGGCWTWSWEASQLSSP